MWATKFTDPKPHQHEVSRHIKNTVMYMYKMFDSRVDHGLFCFQGSGNYLFQFLLSGTSEILQICPICFNVQRVFHMPLMIMKPCLEDSTRLCRIVSLNKGGGEMLEKSFFISSISDRVSHQRVVFRLMESEREASTSMAQKSFDGIDR